jgi:hypothetical protein
MIEPAGRRARIQLTITVDDVDALCRKLGERGVTFLDRSIDRPVGRPNRRFRRYGRPRLGARPADRDELIDRGPPRRHRAATATPMPTRYQNRPTDVASTPPRH